MDYSARAVIANSEGVRSIKKGHSPYFRERPFCKKINLDHGDIRGGRAFWALLDIKGHAIAVVEGFKTGRIYC